jgi:hypothetical protein
VRERKLENRNNLLFLNFDFYFVCSSMHPRKDPLGKWLHDEILLSKNTDPYDRFFQTKIPLLAGPASNSKVASSTPQFRLISGL